MSTTSISDLENRLGNFFSRVPSLPSDIKQLIVDYGPYLVLIGGILTIVSFSGILNLFLVGSPLLGGMFLYNYYLWMLYSIISGIVQIVAFKPLRSKKLSGWRMLFYLTLIYSALSVLSLQLLSLLGPLIAFYILFQIKSNYS